MTRGHVAWFGLALCLIGGCSGGAPAVERPLGYPSACERATGLRSRTTALLEAGQLDRAVRVIDAADALCPSGAQDTLPVLLAALLDLGRDDDAGRVCDRIEEATGASAASRAAAHSARSLLAGRAKDPSRPDPERLFRSAVAARKAGDAPGAQRLFDRALVDLERAAAILSRQSPQPVRLDVSNGFDDDIRKSVWAGPSAPHFMLELTNSIATVDVSTFQARTRLALPGDAYVLAMSTDGSLVAIEHHLRDKDSTVKLELRDGGTLGLLRELASWNDGVTMRDGRFSADGSILTARTDKEVLGWDVTSGAPLTSTPTPHGAQQNPESSAPTTPSDWPESEWRHLGPHASEMLYVGWEPGTGRWLSGSADGAARRWDPQTGRVLSRIETMNGEAIAWSPDAQRIVGGCGERPPPRDPRVQLDRGKHLCMWDSSGLLLHPLGELDVQKSRDRPRVAARFGPDGQQLAILSAEGLKVWDVHGARLLRTLVKWYCSRDDACSALGGFDFGAGGDLWALGGGLHRWRPDGSSAPAPYLPIDGPAGESWHTLVLPPTGDLIGVSSSTRSELFSRQKGIWLPGIIEGDARFFGPRSDSLFVAREGRIDAVDVASKKLLFSFPHPDSLNVEAFSADGRELLVGYHRGDYLFSGRTPGGSMRLWSATTGRAIATIRPVDGTDDSYVMTEGPDGRIEFFGDAGRKHAFCRSGALTLPFEACAERFEVKGLLEKQRKGDLSYLDP